MTPIRIICISFIVTVIALTSPSLRAEAGSDSASTDVENIRQISVRIDSAYATGNGAAMAALVTDDVIWMPPEEPTITGRSAVEERYTKMFGELRNRFKDITHSLEVEEVRVCGDWAMSRGRWRLEMTLMAVPRTIVVTGKNTHIYRRQPDGHWLIARNIWNSDAPVRRGPEQ
jgi:uncharacterized protein (TIGR02246 family)